MCLLRNIAMHDYQKSGLTMRDYWKSMTTRQTDAGQSDPYVPLWFTGDTKMTWRNMICLERSRGQEIIIQVSWCCSVSFILPHHRSSLCYLGREAKFVRPRKITSPFGFALGWQGFSGLNKLKSPSKLGNKCILAIPLCPLHKFCVLLHDKKIENSAQKRIYSNSTYMTHLSATILGVITICRSKLKILHFVRKRDGITDRWTDGQTNEQMDNPSSRCPIGPF